MKKGIILLIAAGMLAACGGSPKETAETAAVSAKETTQPAKTMEESTEFGKGTGEIWQGSTGAGVSGEGGAWLDEIHPDEDEGIQSYAQQPAAGAGYTPAEGDYILPDSDKRYIGREELWHLDEAQLRLAKNEIYARHGLIFQEEDLRDYFNSKPWYYGCVPAQEFDEDLYLAEYEKDTVHMIDMMVEGIGPFYGTTDFGLELPWLGVYFSEDGQVISVIDMSEDGVEITFSGYTEEGDYTYTTWFPYVGDDKTQVVDNGDYPLQQTVFTLKEDGIQVEVLPDGGWAAGFYTRQ